MTSWRNARGRRSQTRANRPGGHCRSSRHGCGVGLKLQHFHFPSPFVEAKATTIYGDGLTRSDRSGPGCAVTECCTRQRRHAEGNRDNPPLPNAQSIDAAFSAVTHAVLRLLRRMPQV